MTTTWSSLLPANKIRRYLSMNNNNKSVRTGRVATLAIAVSLGVASLSAHASETFTYDGYLRQEFSWNMKNWKDTPFNDRGKMSMMRSTARLNLNWNPTGNVYVVAKLRASKEARTSFLKKLEKQGAGNYHDKKITRELYDQADVRELFVDFPIGDRVSMRLGKQQIVWGETDFFAANDLVHGYDYTWRSFLEPANEELRKANIIAKMNIDFPEQNGDLEVFVRPGWDRKKDIGQEIDIYGGRWSSQPYAGVDFRNIDPYNFRHKHGDRRDPTGGIRWSALAGSTNYSLSFLRSFYNAPIMNASDGPVNNPNGNIRNTSSKPTRGMFGEIIYPVVNIFGATASRYFAAADAVFSTEVAYIKDAPFNYVDGNPSVGSMVVAPGFDGYKRKDVVASMIRMDKNIAATQKWLGTEKPMFLSVQLFDKWVQSYNKKDQLLYSVGWGGKVKRHTTIGTAIFDMSYKSGRVKPNLVVGGDLTNGGGFAVPSVTFELSKNLRWKVEYDHFWDSGHNPGAGNGTCQPGTMHTCEGTKLFGYFHNRDQLYTSLTYLF